MRKIIFPVVSATVFFAFSPFAFAGGPEILPVPDYFNGAYVGFIGGLHEAAIKSSTETNIPDAFDLFSLIGPLPLTFTALADSFNTGTDDGYSFDGYYGVQGGLGKVFDHRWYLGVMGFGEWGSQTHNSTGASNFGRGVFVGEGAAARISDGIANSTVTVQVENDYGVAAKFGYLVAPKTMVYAKMGVIWGNLKVSDEITATSDFSEHIASDGGGVDFIASSTLTAAGSASDTKAAYLFGGGVEQYIYQDIFSLNIEYNYANFGTVTTPAAHLVLNSDATVRVGGVLVDEESIENQVTPATTQSKGAAKISMLMAGLNVHFGSNWF